VPYRIEYSPVSEMHLRTLTARQRTTVLDAIDAQLTHDPTIGTRNRKPMRPNPVAPLELRVGNLRVYFDVDERDSIVFVRAIGLKIGNKVRIGREVIEL
jgi:mRNA-degrading endonuclease RelE of RelBE toxin-antitoxin system